MAQEIPRSNQESKALETVVSEDIQLFNGEVLLKEDGIYTKIHTYKHPIKDIEIILLGEMHIGTKGYYEAMEPYLDRSDLIMYERVAGPKIRTRKNERVINAYRKDLYNGMMEACQACFLKSARLRVFSDYKRKINYHRKRNEKWIPVDAAYNKKRADKMEKQVNKMIDEALKQLGDDRKRQAFDFYFAKLIKIEQGIFELRELEDILVFSYSAGGILTILEQTPLVTIRDEYVVNQLQKKVKKRDTPENIAIFYGSGHMMGIRKLLEKEDYNQIRSEEIRAVKY